MTLSSTGLPYDWNIERHGPSSFTAIYIIASIAYEVTIYLLQTALYISTGEAKPKAQFLMGDLLYQSPLILRMSSDCAWKIFNTPRLEDHDIRCLYSVTLLQVIEPLTRSHLLVCGWKDQIFHRWVQARDGYLARGELMQLSGIMRRYLTTSLDKF